MKSKLDNDQDESGPCRLCGGPAAAEYAVLEMRLGTRDEFTYSECATCGALQRKELDLDLAPFYPRDYYAHAVQNPGRARTMARRVRNWLALAPRSPVRRMMNRLVPHPADRWLSITGARPDTRILDVGCGKGTLLAQLADAGFGSLAGVDPFLPPELETGPSVRMTRAEVSAIGGEFDLVMFHHSLEHILDQDAALASAARLLAPGGWCIVRVPTVSSFAWAEYRESWFQIDAPRHFVLHSLRSLRALAERAGLEVVRIDFDSEHWQILWSEAYRRGIAMADVPSFPATETRAAAALADRLNAEGRGDQVCAFFRKPLSRPAPG